jgi:UDP-2,3-diacylglucosamine pyrophosphatase LpxH
MLVIASDIHLGDGSCGKSISPSAFHLFSERLRELAFNASWRKDNTYTPLEQIDILLMGDILDPLHSALWLKKGLSEPGFVRPWTDHHSPEYAATLKSITEAILHNNTEAVSILKALSENGIILPKAAQLNRVISDNDSQVVVKVRIFYMVGNHDWYYHLPGEAFDSIRKELIDAMGLANPIGPFPHELHESETLKELLSSYQVYAQHGDLYDTFNFNKEEGRDSSTIGDAFAVEIINRFPVEARNYMKNDLPEDFLDNLRELVNVRPALATPLWISSQLRQNNISEDVQKKFKNLWDELANEFLKLPIVRSADKRGKLDVVDGLQLAIKLTDRFSFKTIDDLVVWIRKKFWSEEITYSKHALKEAAFLNHSALFIVYGHTHHYEIVPLESLPPALHPTNQMYFNSGTWHTYFDLAVYKPQEQKFIPYQVLSYLTFFKGDESRGRHFETWSGAFSN